MDRASTEARWSVKEMKLPRKWRVNVHQTMKDACVKTELKMWDSNEREREHSENLLNIYLSLYLFE